MAQKIGPKEEAQRALREANYASRSTVSKKHVGELKEAVAAVPVKRAPKPKKPLR